MVYNSNVLRVLKNKSFIILTTSLILSFAEYLLASQNSGSAIIQISKLTQIFALTALIYLYITLLINPFYQTFTDFPLKDKVQKSKNDFIIMTFYFAFIHASFAFFGELGGFAGLGFLSQKFITAITLSFSALIILFILTVSSFNFLLPKVKLLQWKFLPKFLYIVGILVLIHALMLGSDFNNLSGNIPLILYIAISFLLLLQGPNIDKIFAKYIKMPTFGLSFLLLSITLSVVFFTVISPVFSTTNGGVSFDIHAAHRQLAQQAAKESLSSQNQSKIPGLNGDRTRRFTVSMSTDPQILQSNQDTTIHFKVYDASSGNSISSYQILYTKLMHFVIVNNDLTYFSHIHPDFQNGEFFITTQFPKDDIYHLYISFQPLGGIEQQVGFNLTVGQPQKNSDIFGKENYNTTKRFGKYKVSFDSNDTLNAADMSHGLQKINFSIRDSKTGKPVTTLKPYLGAFGHLTIINEKTYDYIHVHPNSLIVPPPDASSGPTVDFLPIGIYGPFKPGIYKAFAEFNPDNNLFVADFDIKIN